MGKAKAVFTSTMRGSVGLVANSSPTNFAAFSSFSGRAWAYQFSISDASEWPGALNRLHVRAVDQKPRCLGMAQLVDLQAVEAVRLVPQSPPTLEGLRVVEPARVRAAYRHAIILLDTDLHKLD